MSVGNLAAKRQLEFGSCHRQLLRILPDLTGSYRILPDSFHQGTMLVPSSRYCLATLVYILVESTEANVNKDSCSLLQNKAKVELSSVSAIAQQVNLSAILSTMFHVLTSE